jgi:circadian clock protein KaiC
MGTGMAASVKLPERISTGSAGLDEILCGGLLARRGYLLRGGPGLGKTTLGLTFLSSGADNESALFIGFQEPEDELRANAYSVGIDTSGIHFLSLAATEEFFTEAEAYDVFAASDVEQTPMVNAVLEAVEEHRPTRVFVDSLTQLRFLTADLAQFRKQVTSFLRFLAQRGATVVFTSESTTEVPDDDLQFLADGIIELAWGPTSATLAIKKFRGSGFRRGRHPYRVDGNGFGIFSQTLPPPQEVVDAAPDQFASGNPELDAMLHGGIEAGTVTLLTGPTGIGKSTLAGMFAAQAARAGRRAAVYQFEEELNGWLIRLRTLGVEVDEPRHAGQLILEQVEPLRYFAEEFADVVRSQVETYKLQLVVIDSIAGFSMALGAEHEANRPLHALVKTLTRLGVAVILINENRAIVEAAQITESQVSYIADNVIYLRYHESGAVMEKTLGILKKRLSGFDSCQRRFEVAPGGIHISDLQEAPSVGNDSDGAGAPG